MTNKVEIVQLSQVVNNEQNFLKALNANLVRIQNAINDTLSRTGKLPNQMEQILDMNGKRIANVGDPVDDNDVPTKAYINGIVQQAQEAIANINSIVDNARRALQQYATDYIYPTAQAALDGATAAKAEAVAAATTATTAKTAAESARDALLLNSGYQAVVANIASLTALANNLTKVTALYNDLSKLEGIYNKLSEITAVSENITSVDLVADALSDIGTVATNVAAITLAAANISSISSVAEKITNIVDVAEDLDNIDAVQAKLTEIAGVYNNLSGILAAATHAANAATWAEGSDAAVAALGGQHSSKGWAEYAAAIVTGVKIYGGAFDASTKTATLSSSAKIRLHTDASTIVLTNDTTPVTGYTANEAIEYQVSVEGTFAGLTLRVNDIVWSSGAAWHKIDNSETVIADATESTKGILKLATVAEAEDGSEDTKAMTALKTKKAIEALAPQPIVPSDATVTVTQGGTTKGTFTLNQSNDVTIALDVGVSAADVGENTIDTTALTLSDAQRTTLLATGKYRGGVMEAPAIMPNGQKFVANDGTTQVFNDTIGDVAINEEHILLDTTRECVGTYVINDKIYITTTYGGILIYDPATGHLDEVSIGDSHSIENFGCFKGVFYAVADIKLYTATNPLGPWTSQTLEYGTYYTTYTRSSMSPNTCIIYTVRGNYYYTTDGLTWTKSPTRLYSDYTFIAYGDGKFLCCGNDGSHVQTSTDGITWTSQLSTGTQPSSDKCIGFYDGTQYVVYATKSKVMTTPDGFTWTKRNTADISDYNVLGLAYGNGMYVTLSEISGNKTPVAVYTTDLETWHTVEFDTNEFKATPAFYNGYFYTMGRTSKELIKFTIEAEHIYSLTPLTLSKTATETALAAKQGTLTAGTGIAIDSNNVISVTGGGSSYDPSSQEITL